MLGASLPRSAPPATSSVEPHECFFAQYSRKTLSPLVGDDAPAAEAPPAKKAPAAKKAPVAAAADGDAPAKKAPVKKAPAKKAPPKAAPKPTGPVLTNSAQYSRQSQYELGWFGKFDDAKTGDERSKKILARFDKVGGSGEQVRTPERVRAEIEAIEARKAAAVARIKGGN